VLKELGDEEMEKIIERTGFKLDKKAKEWLISMANGDARAAITMLENTGKFYKKINLANLKETLQINFALRQERGRALQHHKRVYQEHAASNPDAALYYLARMVAQEKIRSYRKENGRFRLRRYRTCPADGACGRQ